MGRGGFYMRLALERETKTPLQAQLLHETRVIDLDGDALRVYLNQTLRNVMSNSLDPTLKRPTENYVNNLFGDLLGDFDDRLILATKNDSGLLIGLIKKEGFHITTLGVDPRYRQQKIGTALLESARQYMQKLSIDRMFLNVDERNHIAVQMYTDDGFKEFR